MVFVLLGLGLQKTLNMSLGMDAVGGCNGEQEQSGCSFIYITHSRRLAHRTSC